MPWRVDSGPTSGWQGCVDFIDSSCETGILFKKNRLSVLDPCSHLFQTAVPLQFELDKVPTNTTHANYSVDLLLHNDLAEATVLEWSSVVARDLTRLAVRPVIKHDDPGI